jgi:hypothetical protein
MTPSIAGLLAVVFDLPEGWTNSSAHGSTVLLLSVVSCLLGRVGVCSSLAVLTFPSLDLFSVSFRSFGGRKSLDRCPLVLII